MGYMISSRFVTAVILISFLVAAIQSARGQTIVPNSNERPREVAKLNNPDAQQNADQTAADSQGNQTVAWGMVEGEVAAKEIKTGGKFALGVCVGFLSGLIGTGIGYSFIGSETMTVTALQQFSDKNASYQLGFKLWWDNKTQSRKRKSFVAGGLLGTAAIVAIIVSKKK